jgi:PIN domain nuclease of toxin-antitoxin system
MTSTTLCRKTSWLHSKAAHDRQSALAGYRFPDSIEVGVAQSGFEQLTLKFSHTERVAALPFHHRDPFDRMLVAQASAEDLTLVTHDRQLEPYEVRILWA